MTAPVDAADARIRPAILIDPAAERYRQDLASQRFASLFSSPPWLEAVAQSFGLEVRASACLDGGRLVAALPFCHVRDFRGERVVCLPFSDYCDPLVEDLATWRALVAPLLELGAPVRLRCLRNRIAESDARFGVTGRALWHAIDLERSEDAMWAALAGSARQNVRKALAAGVVVREGRSVLDVRIFHAMHCHVRKSKYRLLAQPLAFFEQLHRTFAPDDRITVLLAEHEGVPIAGIFFLRWGDTLYYKFNASLDLRWRPNDLLAWEGMRLGRRQGLARLDFGLSDGAQAGLVRYKRKFATEQREIAFLEWRPPHYTNPHGDLASSTLHRVTRLLTEPSVPDAITRAAGDELYRFFC